MEDLPRQEFVDLGPQQNPELGQRAPSDSKDSGRRPGLGARRWGIVNAALCGLLVVAFVVAMLLGFLPGGVLPAALDNTGRGIFSMLMVLFFIPIACVPIGISCLAGALRARAVLRGHPSREARLGLWLSLGGPIAVIACYVLFAGVFFL